MRLRNGIVIIINSTHDVEFDQAGSLHGSVIDHTVGILEQITYIDGPGSVILWKESLNLTEKGVHAAVRVICKGFIDGRAFIAAGVFIFCSLLLLFLFLQLIQLVCLADKGIGRIGYFCHSIRERLNFFLKGSQVTEREERQSSQTCQRNHQNNDDYIQKYGFFWLIIIVHLCIPFCCVYFFLFSFYTEAK